MSLAVNFSTLLQYGNFVLECHANKDDVDTGNPLGQGSFGYKPKPLQYMPIKTSWKHYSDSVNEIDAEPMPLMLVLDAALFNSNAKAFVHMQHTTHPFMCAAMILHLEFFGLVARIFGAEVIGGKYSQVALFMTVPSAKNAAVPCAYVIILFKNDISVRPGEARVLNDQMHSAASLSVVLHKMFKSLDDIDARQLTGLQHSCQYKKDDVNKTVNILEAEIDELDRINQTQHKQSAAAASTTGRITQKSEHIQRHAKYSFQRMTYDTYTKMCMMYHKKKVMDSDEKIFSKNCNINPYTIFSMNKGCELLRELGAHPLYCDPESYGYTDGSTATKMPEDGINCTRIPIECLYPGQILNFYFPSVEKPIADDDWQVERFTSQMVIDAEEGSELYMELKQQAELDMKESMDVYSELCNNFPMKRDEDGTMDAFKVKVARAKSRLHRECKGDTQRFNREWQDKCENYLIKDFALLCSPDADITSAMRAICTWMNEHLKGYENFRLPDYTQFKNLSFLGNILAKEAINLEAVGGVVTLHKQIMQLKLAVHQLYTQTKFHLHSLYTGPFGTGKSHSYNHVLEQLIKGTIQAFTYATVKSDAAANRWSDMIYVYEDAPPQMLGADSGLSNKGNGAGGSEQVASLQDLITRGVISCRYQETDMATGKRVSRSHSQRANHLIWIASNISEGQIPPPLKSRLLCQILSAENRIDKSIESAMRVKKNSDTTKLEAEIKMRWERDQALSAIIGYMMYVGLLPRVDTSVADAYFGEIIQKAREAGVQNTRDVRHLERLKFAVEGIVIWRVIRYLNDSEASPFKGQKFDMAHMLQYGPYLCSTKEDALYVIELFESQWDNKILAEAVRHMSTENFAIPASVLDTDLPMESRRPALVVTNQAGSALGIVDTVSTEGAIEEQLSYTPNSVMKDRNYFHVSFDANGSTGSMVVVGKGKTKQGVMMSHTALCLQTLTNELHEKMDPKPTWFDIFDALSKLTNTRIPNNDGYGNNGTIPALKFDAGRLFLAIDTIFGNSRNRFDKAIRAVACHPYTEEFTYISGSIHPRFPYAWSTKHIKPDPNGKPLQITMNNHFNSGILKSVHSSVSHMHEECINAKVSTNVTGAFTTRPFLNVDIDMDVWGVQMFLEQNGYTDEFIKRYNLPPPDVIGQRKFIMERHHKCTMTHWDQLLTYPDCFEKASKNLARLKKSTDAHFMCDLSMAADSMTAKAVVSGKLSSRKDLDTKEKLRSSLLSRYKAYADLKKIKYTEEGKVAGQTVRPTHSNMDTSTNEPTPSELARSISLIRQPHTPVVTTRKPQQLATPGSAATVSTLNTSPIHFSYHTPNNNNTHSHSTAHRHVISPEPLSASSDNGDVDDIDVDAELRAEASMYAEHREEMTRPSPVKPRINMRSPVKRYSAPIRKPLTPSEDTMEDVDALMSGLDLDAITHQHRQQQKQSAPSTAPVYYDHSMETDNAQPGHPEDPEETLI